MREETRQPPDSSLIPHPSSLIPSDQGTGALFADPSADRDVIGVAALPTLRHFSPRPLQVSQTCMEPARVAIQENADPARTMGVRQGGLEPVMQ